MNHQSKIVASILILLYPLPRSHAKIQHSPHHTNSLGESPPCSHPFCSGFHGCLILFPRFSPCFYRSLRRCRPPTMWSVKPSFPCRAEGTQAAPQGPQGRSREWHCDSWGTPKSSICRWGFSTGLGIDVPFWGFGSHQQNKYLLEMK